MDFFYKRNLSTILSNGDDNLTLFVPDDSGSIASDIKSHVNDQEGKNGLVFQDPTVKGEARYFYNQCRYDPKDGTFTQPLSRIRLY